MSEVGKKITKLGSFPLRIGTGAAVGAIAGAKIPEDDPQLAKGVLLGALAGMLIPGKKRPPKQPFIAW